MKISSTLLACCLLWLATGAVSSAATAQKGPAPLAQSAQLTVLATVDDEWLILRIQHAGTQAPVTGKDVSVSVAGHAMPVKARSDGTFVLPVKQLGTTHTPTLDIIVAHDGIREILSGQVTLPQAAPAAKGGGNNIWYWILNVAIVFAVAMYFTNRKKPETVD